MSASGKAQALCREPDKVVLARVVRGPTSTLLVSAPVEFASESAFLGTARFRLLGDVLVCVLYSSAPGEGVSYRFLRDGMIVQESESPFLNLAASPCVSGLGGSGGTYEV